MHAKASWLWALLQASQLATTLAFVSYSEHDSWRTAPPPRLARRAASTFPSASGDQLDQLTEPRLLRRGKDEAKGKKGFEPTMITVLKPGDTLALNPTVAFQHIQQQQQDQGNTLESPNTQHGRPQITHSSNVQNDGLEDAEKGELLERPSSRRGSRPTLDSGTNEKKPTDGAERKGIRSGIGKPLTNLFKKGKHSSKVPESTPQSNWAESHGKHSPGLNEDDSQESTQHQSQGMFAYTSKSRDGPNGRGRGSKHTLETPERHSSAPDQHTSENFASTSKSSEDSSDARGIRGLLHRAQSSKTSRDATKEAAESGGKEDPLSNRERELEEGERFRGLSKKDIADERANALLQKQPSGDRKRLASLATDLRTIVEPTPSKSIQESTVTEPHHLLHTHSSPRSSRGSHPDSFATAHSDPDQERHKTYKKMYQAWLEENDHYYGFKKAWERPSNGAAKHAENNEEDESDPFQSFAKKHRGQSEDRTKDKSKKPLTKLRKALRKGRGDGHPDDRRDSMQAGLVKNGPRLTGPDHLVLPGGGSYMAGDKTGIITSRIAPHDEQAIEARKREEERKLEEFYRQRHGATVPEQGNEGSSRQHAQGRWTGDSSLQPEDNGKNEVDRGNSASGGVSTGTSKKDRESADQSSSSRTDLPGMRRQRTSRLHKQKSQLMGSSSTKSSGPTNYGLNQKLERGQGHEKSSREMEEGTSASKEDEGSVNLQRYKSQSPQMVVNQGLSPMDSKAVGSANEAGGEGKSPDLSRPTEGDASKFTQGADQSGISLRKLKNTSRGNLVKSGILPPAPKDSQAEADQGDMKKSGEIAQQRSKDAATSESEAGGSQGGLSLRKLKNTSRGNLVKSGVLPPAPKDSQAEAGQGDIKKSGEIAQQQSKDAATSQSNDGGSQGGLSMRRMASTTPQSLLSQASQGSQGSVSMHRMSGQPPTANAMQRASSSSQGKPSLKPTTQFQLPSQPPAKSGTSADSSADHEDFEAKFQNLFRSDQKDLPKKEDEGKSDGDSNGSGSGNGNGDTSS